MAKKKTVSWILSRTKCRLIKINLSRRAHIACSLMMLSTFRKSIRLMISFHLLLDPRSNDFVIDSSEDFLGVQMGSFSWPLLQSTKTCSKIRRTSTQSMASSRKTQLNQLSCSPVSSPTQLASASILTFTTSWTYQLIIKANKSYSKTQKPLVLILNSVHF